MTAAPSPVTTDHQLMTGPIDTLPVSAVRAPQLTVVQWLIAAAAPRATHSAWSSAVALSGAPEAAPVMTALGQPGLDRLPEVMIPIAPSHDSTVTDNLTMLRDTSPAALAAAIATCWDGNPPVPWRVAIDRPRDWIRAYAGALGSTWSVGERRWRAGLRAVDGEIARIGVAAVTGALPALLNSLHPRLRYRDGVIAFRNSCATAFELGRRRLALVPMLTPSNRIVVSFDRPDVAYIAYPASAQPRRADHGGQAPDRLALVLGPARAAVLRALDRPRTMGELAAETHFAASTATYHCDHLEPAGLVRRERRGPAVWVSRTSPGAQLVDLLS